jgi:hypothetical protein
VAWTCPDCSRQFGAVGRSHICAPGLTVEEFVASARPEAGPILERLIDHLSQLDGDLIIDPLARKVLFKNGPTVAILESKTKWMALGLTLRRRLESPRLSRKVAKHPGGFWHVVNLTSADDIDDDLLEWLTEAYYRERQPPAGGSMVPDDVDDPFR